MKIKKLLTLSFYDSNRVQQLIHGVQLKINISNDGGGKRQLSMQLSIESGAQLTGIIE